MISSARKCRSRNEATKWNNHLYWERGAESLEIQGQAEGPRNRLIQPRTTAFRVPANRHVGQDTLEAFYPRPGILQSQIPYSISVFFVLLGVDSFAILITTLK